MITIIDLAMKGLPPSLSEQPLGLTAIKNGKVFCETKTIGAQCIEVEIDLLVFSGNDFAFISGKTTPIECIEIIDHCVFKHHQHDEF